MAERRGMGRGLAAILTAPEAPGGAEDAPELRQVPVAAIAPSPGQPRKHFDEEALQALAGSLRERGVLQPVLVRERPGGRFELVAGERRWRAARLAGFETLPALVQDHDDAAALEVALVENMAREDLNPVEEARAVAALVEDLGLTREEVGRRVGRSRVAISNLLRILDLPDDALAHVEAGRLSEGHARALLLADDHRARRRLAEAAVAEGWSVRVTEQRARDSNAPERPARRGRAAASADQAEAAERIADAFGAALGREVRVRPKGTGWKVELELGSVEEAETLVATLRASGGRRPSGMEGD